MAYIMKKITQRMPDGLVRTHYMRLAGMGDGPITSPDQDPSTGAIVQPQFDPTSDETVATVGPIITGTPPANCGGWFNPCPQTGSGVTTNVTDDVAAAASAVVDTFVPNATDDSSSILKKLLFAAALVGGVYYFTRDKKQRVATTRRTTR